MGSYERASDFQRELTRNIEDAVPDALPFDEVLMDTINLFFKDMHEDWRARFYSYVMESDCLDYIQINRLMEAANG